jgi:hypothetical protein
MARHNHRGDVAVASYGGRESQLWRGGSARGGGERRVRCCYCELVRQRDRRVRSGAPGCGWSELEGRAASWDGHRPLPPLYGCRVAVGQAGKVGVARPRAGEREGGRAERARRLRPVGRMGGTRPIKVKRIFSISIFK